MEKTFKNGQSCGMPLKKDPERGSRNADGGFTRNIYKLKRWNP